LAMALPSRSYSARSSPLLPSVGGRHTCTHIHQQSPHVRIPIDNHQVFDPFAN
jgi:hypothetical protein